MKPLLVLLSAFIISILISFLVFDQVDYSFSGIIAMAVMLVFTAVAHFIFTEGIMKMIPNTIKNKGQWVWITGILEIVLAIGLLFPSYRVNIGWLLILFFIIILPANVYAAWHNINYKTATYDGPGLSYLWLRIPVQCIYIAWVYIFVML